MSTLALEETEWANWVVRSFCPAQIPVQARSLRTIWEEAQNSSW